jgi:signal transduction histidine kinase
MSLAAMSLTMNGQNRVYRAITLGAASLAIIIGSFMVVAWLSHSEWLWVTIPGIFQMKFNTALAFVAGGTGLLAASRDQKGYACGAGCAVLFFSGVTLIQYLTSQNFYIDELLMKDYWYPDNPIRGRMSPGTSVAFLCFSVVLILAASEKGRPFSRLVTMELLSFAVLAISTAAIVGYLTSVTFAYSWGSFARLSIHTAAGFMALGTGMLALVWHRQNIRIARVPLWIPAFLCFIVLLLDLSTPLGLAAGIGYIPIIFCSLWFVEPYMAFTFAAVSTGLTVLGYFAKLPGEFAIWIPAANRVLTIGALWFVATLVYLRRRTELALQTYMSDLKRSNQELDDFAYIASHDLKEPLRGLFNHATFLLEDYKDTIDADGVRRLTRLGQLCQRMERLINDLMYFSRLGRADLAVQKTDPNAVIAEIGQMMETVLSERHARVVVPCTLPQIVCDKTRVTEVFRNLISNAVKYNDKSERLVEIGFLESIDTEDGPERNVFYVKDNGVGIDPEFHHEIFRIFKRLQDASDGPDTGTGVGLTFVKKIIERHDGRIWLNSEPGKGTIFYFNLNRERNEPARNAHEAAIEPIPVHSAG